MIWQHKDGRLFYGQDSGCSCPSPFENFNSLADLTPITKTGFESFVKTLRSYADESYGNKLKISELLEAEKMVGDLLK